MIDSPDDTHDTDAAKVVCQAESPDHTVDTDAMDAADLVPQAEPAGDTDVIGLLRQADPVDEEELAQPKDSPVARANFEEITDIPYNEDD
jgi:hypothetical protein